MREAVAAAQWAEGPSCDVWRGGGRGRWGGRLCQSFSFRLLCD